jgi:agmatinase
MLSYVGVPTFLRGALRDVGTEWRADVGVLGVPYDIALGFRPGARFAPRALREASLRFAPGDAGWYDWQTDTTRFVGRTIADLGDVDLPSLEPELAHERITAAARALRARVALPLFLGGDHSISWPVLRAFDDVEGLHVVQLDAHLDFTDVRDGTKWSNSSPFRRAVEALPNLSRVTTIGVRGLRADPEAVAAARSRGHRMVGASAVGPDAESAIARLPHDLPVYLSIDVDVFDPSIVPGTSSPEVMGLSYQQVIAVVRHVMRTNRVVGVDCVELTPSLDPSGGSALTIARLLADTVALAFP